MRRGSEEKREAVAINRKSAFLPKTINHGPFNAQNQYFSSCNINSKSDRGWNVVVLVPAGLLINFQYVFQFTAFIVWFILTT